MQTSTNAKFNLPGYDDIVDIRMISENFEKIDSDCLFNTGGTMRGTLNMGNQQLTGLKAPNAGSDASTKAYTDTADEAIRAEVDANKKAIQYVTVTLPAANWSAEIPYSQEVAVSGMTETWVPGAPVLVPGDDENADIQMRRAYACVNTITSGIGTLTFTCRRRKPSATFSILIPGMIAR